MTDPKIQSLSSKVCQTLTSNAESQKECQGLAGLHLGDSDRTFCKPPENKTSSDLIRCFRNNMDSWASTYDISVGDGDEVIRIPNRVYWKFFDTVKGSVPRLPDLNKVYDEVVVLYFKQQFIVKTYANLAEIGFKNTPLTAKTREAGDGDEAEITAHRVEEKAVVMWKTLQDIIAKNANKEEENKVYVTWPGPDKDKPITVLLSKITSDMSYAEMVEMSKAQFLFMKRAVIKIVESEEKEARAAGNVALANDFKGRAEELKSQSFEFPYSEAELAERLHMGIQEVADAYFYIIQDNMPLKNPEKSSVEKKALVLDVSGEKYSVGKETKLLAKSYWVTGGKPASLDEVKAVGDAVINLTRRTGMKNKVKVPPEIGDKPKTLSGSISGEYSTAGSMAPNLFADLKIAMVGNPKEGFFLQGRISALYLDQHPGTVHPDGPVSTADDVANPKESLQIIYAYLMGQYVFDNKVRLHGKAGVVDPRNRTTPGIAFDRLHQGNGEGQYQVGRITGATLGVDIPLQSDAEKPISIGVETSLGASGNPMIYKENVPGDEKPNTYWFDKDMGGGRFVNTGRVRLFKNPHDEYDSWLESMNLSLGWEVKRGRGDEPTKSKFGIIGEGLFNVIPEKQLLQVGAGFYFDYGDEILDGGVSGLVGLNPWKWLKLKQYVTYGSSGRTYNFGRVDGPKGPFDHSVSVKIKSLSWATQATIGPFEGIPVLDSFEFFLQYMGEKGMEAEEGHSSALRGKAVNSFGVGATATF